MVCIRYSMTLTMWLTAAVTVSVPITHPASRVVGSGSVASSSELFTVVRPSIWDKSRDFEIGQWGRPWLVWYVPCDACKRRCVPRFTKLKHRHRNDRRWRCETHSVRTRWQSVIRTTLFSLSQTNYHSNHWYNDSEMCYYNPLHRSPRFINQYFRLTDQNAKLFTRNHAMCFAEKSAQMRPGC